MSNEEKDKLEVLAKAYRSIRPPSDLMEKIVMQAKMSQSIESGFWLASVLCVVFIALTVLILSPSKQGLRPMDFTQKLAFGPGDLTVPSLSDLSTSSTFTRIKSPSLGSLSGIPLTPTSPKEKKRAKKSNPVPQQKHLPSKPLNSQEEYPDDSFV